MTNKTSTGAKPALNKNRVFTTGEVAKYCGVHFRTVIRWIDRGKLKAFKLPGRGDNRIKEEDFIRFLEENEIPIPADFYETNKRVLIVDDEKEMAAAIQRILKRANYETAIALDGFQAGEMLSTFQPIVMTLDLSMPNMNGFSVLEYMHGHSAYKDVKIIVVSALDELLLKKARTCGAHATLAKPFKKKDLLEKISQLIEPTNL